MARKPPMTKNQRYNHSWPPRVGTLDKILYNKENTVNRLVTFKYCKNDLNLLGVPSRHVWCPSTVGYSLSTSVDSTFF